MILVVGCDVVVLRFFVLGGWVGLVLLIYRFGGTCVVSWFDFG